MYSYGVSFNEDILKCKCMIEQGNDNYNRMEESQRI